MDQTQHRVTVHVDEKSYRKDVLVFRGWAMCEGKAIDKLSFYLVIGRRKIPLLLETKRDHTDPLRKVSFFHKSAVSTRRFMHLYLVCVVEGEQQVISCGTLLRPLPETAALYGKLFTWENFYKGCGLLFHGEFRKLKEIFLTKTTPPLPAEQKDLSWDSLKPFLTPEARQAWRQLDFSQRVDIIVPVYNGLVYLDKLFQGLVKTKVPFHLIVIDDKSPDPEVMPALSRYVSAVPGAELLQNETNLGFVRTVNRGLSLARGNVVLLNTDIQLPDQWLERLIAPILLDKATASATPFTNSGTLVSFPEIGIDNDVFRGLDVNEVDQVFRQISPVYTQAPTGVGFCMAMSRRALDAIGLLDEQAFGRGYGEENDWCQRAVSRGFRNVCVENLYVFHNHGGSFTSSEKSRLIEEHEEILKKRWPDYMTSAALFFSEDPLLPIRKYLLNETAARACSRQVLYFNHMLGGGADAYLRKCLRKRLQEKELVLEVCYDYKKDVYRLTAYFHTLSSRIFFSTRQSLFDYLGTRSLQEICINELVTYPDLSETLSLICSLAQASGAALIMLMHDYFAICPVLTLLNPRGQYCGIPDTAVCEACLKGNPQKRYEACHSLAAWRESWGHVLARCQEVRCFSPSSRQLVLRAYPFLTNVSVVPHTVDYLPAFTKTYKTTKGIHAAVLGTLAVHKGLFAVRDLALHLDKTGSDLDLVILGSLEETDSPAEHKAQQELLSCSHVKIHGRYRQQELPKLLMIYDIDLIFIPSVWPETFSFTTEEAIRMHMPLAVFDFGAPAERTASYEKGIVLPSEDPASVDRQLHALYARTREGITDVSQKKPVLLLAEENNYASRYRMEHFQEQLLLSGQPARYLTFPELKGRNLHAESFQQVVLYRLRKNPKVTALLEQIRQKGVPVCYDIDDLLFDFSSIQEESFVKEAPDADYRAVCEDTRLVMDQADAYTSSTRTLAREIRRQYPSRPVTVRRNAASMEMVELSELAVRNAMPDENHIYLGYFSGSFTHDHDLQLIEPVLVRILEKYPRTKLLFGGILDIPASLSANISRIERLPYREWTRLPAALRRADIHLMPLQDSLFHACKSENKWMEAALVRRVTVCSETEELRTIIRNGEDGFLCRSQEDWFRVLSRLIENEELRTQAGENAYAHVLADHTTRAMAGLKEDV